jgi:hypothetical protein
MSLDDELRRRLQQAADQAGAGTDPAALTHQVTKQAAVGARPPLRLLGAIGAAGLVAGGALGFTALRPGDTAQSTDRQVVVAEQIRRHGLYDCPRGGEVGVAHAGDRLFVVGRSDDGGWLAVRAVDGGNISWLAAAALTADDDREVPTLTCTETTAMNTGTEQATTSTIGETTTTVDTSTTVATTVPATTTTPTTTPATVPPTAPPTAPPDTQQPSLQASSNATEIFDSSGPECVNEATLTAIATDNVGVTSVTATWSGLPGSPKAFTKGAGNTWTATFGPFSGIATPNQLVTITITARDAAGNTRATAVQITVWGEGMCLI